MNPLSYPIGTKFTGKTLNEWLLEQIDNHTGNEKIAQKIYNHFILKNDKIYQLVRMPYRTNGKLKLGFVTNIWQLLKIMS